MEPKIYKVYHLSCPITGDVKYIGMTTRTLGWRLSGHIGLAKRPTKYYLSNMLVLWIQSLLKQGLRPKITLLEESKDQGLEKQYIQYFKEQGCDLLNNTSGERRGYKVLINTPHSEETKLKLSLSLKKYWKGVKEKYYS